MEKNRVQNSETGELDCDPEAVQLRASYSSFRDPAPIWPASRRIPLRVLAVSGAVDAARRRSPDAPFPRGGHRGPRDEAAATAGALRLALVGRRFAEAAEHACVSLSFSPATTAKHAPMNQLPVGAPRS